MNPSLKTNAELAQLLNVATAQELQRTRRERDVALELLRELRALVGTPPLERDVYEARRTLATVDALLSTYPAPEAKP